MQQRIVNSRYEPISGVFWQGRDDGPRLHQIVSTVNLSSSHATLPSGAVALIGFACDEGVRRNQGRTGASEGPQAIRKAAANMPLHAAKPLKIYDLGDVTCSDGDLEASQKVLSDVVCQLIKSDVTPIVLGGGHEVAFGHYQGLLCAKPHQTIGILNFDAHFDLRSLLDKNRGSSGTPFLQIAKLLQQNDMPFYYTCVGIQPAGNTASLFNTAKNLDVKFVLAQDVHRDIKTAEHAIDALIKQCDHLYVTLCLDVFASAFAPGVSAPQPLGLFPMQVVSLLEHVVKSGKVVGFDIAELSPPLDANNTTTRLACSMLFSFLHSL